MSGFAGLFRRDGEDATEAELEAMVDALEHRGPDGRGTWRDGAVGLGHRHLRTTPEAQYASIPAVSDDGDCVLTMDARVDNRAALCDALGLDETSTLTDDQLLLAAYDEWGVDCFERIVGAFAVAIYDRERHRMVCARDPIGIKPFQYALDDELFAVGSESKALLSLPSVPTEVDDVSVFAFLTDEFDDPEATFFESVSRLPPGHAMVVEPDSVRRWAYWSADEIEELDLPSDEAYEQRFRELFTEAVRCRLRRPSGTTVASQLSGGIDSTSVAFVAQSLLEPEESLRTLSVTFEGYPTADESEYLRAALDACDFDSCVKDIGGKSPLRDVQDRFADHDAPFYPPLFMIDPEFADELADDDLRVLLSGFGGDESLYYGSSYLSEYLFGGQVGRFLTELDAFADRWNRSKQSVALDTVAGPLAPWPARRLWRRFNGNGAAFEERYPTLDADAAAEAGFVDWVQSRDPRPPFDHREEHRRMVTNPETRFFFESIDVQRATFGLEGRYPFLDRRVVEFCIALPAEQKVRDGVGRNIIRRALGDLLPPKIRSRTDKADSIASWLDGLTRHDQQRLRERVVESPEYVTGYLDEDELVDAYERFIDEPSFEDSWPLVKAYAIETWIRTVRGPG